MDEISPKYLMAGKGGKEHLCIIAWTLGALPLEWQTGAVVSIFRTGDQRGCSNCRGITLFSFPRVLEKRIRSTVEPQIKEEYFEFRMRPGTTDQPFTLTRVLERRWEFSQSVHTWRRTRTGSAGTSCGGFSGSMGWMLPC